MPRNFQCPDVSSDGNPIQFNIQSGARLRCRDSVDLSSEWIELTSPPDTANINDLYTVLSTLNDFNPVQIGTFISIYLVFFIVGISAGSVVRLMKKS